MRQEIRERKSPKGGRHLLGALGRMDSSLAAPFLGGRAKAAPPSPLALYIVGGGRAAIPKPWRLPLPPVTHLPPPAALGEALLESRYFHHHAVVLLDLHQPLLPPCWIKKEETSLLRTCVERGGAVRSALGSSVIWITTSTTPSTPFS